MSSVANAIQILQDRIGSKHGGDPGPDLILSALQEAEREVMGRLPPDARPSKVKISSSLVLTAASDVIAASGFPSDLAVIIGVERDGKPAARVELVEMRAIQSDRNSYWQGSDDNPYYAIGESGVVIDPVGKTGNSAVYLDYLAVPSLTSQGDFAISDQFLNIVMDVAESVIIRRRGPEAYELAMAMQATAISKLGGE